MRCGWRRTRRRACLAAVRGWARFWRVDAAQEEALAEYGRYAGLAFQLVDDLLDFTASAQQLGKPVLSDLKEGKVTLPLIYAMENGHREAREMVAQVLQEKEFNSVRPETLVALVQDSGLWIALGIGLRLRATCQRMFERAAETANMGGRWRRA